MLGPRYQGGHEVKLVGRQFMTFQENYLRVMEQFKEIYYEALRAPEENVTMKRNPYRKEFLIKKFYGKTKTERKETKKLIK